MPSARRPGPARPARHLHDSDSEPRAAGAGPARLSHAGHCRMGRAGGRAGPPHRDRGTPPGRPAGLGPAAAGAGPKAMARAGRVTEPDSEGEEPEWSENFKLRSSD
jgi:hypothetical protein